jgi:NADH dehydrogenase FAD-containing subunit
VGVLLYETSRGYVDKLIAARLAGAALPTPPEPFVPSKLAAIIRRLSVAEYGDHSITGFLAWLLWALLHEQGSFEFRDLPLGRYEVRECPRARGVSARRS